MPNSPDIIILIHSGEWGTIQTSGASQQTFHIENTCDGPVTLSFITENWSPIEARNNFEISWDYEGSPILPGRGMDIVFKLVNKNNNSMICISFDIIITGTTP